MVEDVQISHEGLFAQPQVAIFNQQTGAIVQRGQHQERVRGAGAPIVPFCYTIDAVAVPGVDMILPASGGGRNAMRRPFAMPGALSIHDVNAAETQLMLFVKGVYFASGNADKNLDFSRGLH